jgi:hypothetical protein
MALHPPTPRPNRPARSSQHPSRNPAPEPDLHQLFELGEGGTPDPVTPYELDMEHFCPEVAYEIQVERCAAHARAHMLRLAIEHIEQIMGRRCPRLSGDRRRIHAVRDHHPRSRHGQGAPPGRRPMSAPRLQLYAWEQLFRSWRSQYRQAHLRVLLDRLIDRDDCLNQPSKPLAYDDFGVPERTWRRWIADLKRANEGLGIGHVLEVVDAYGWPFPLWPVELWERR